MLPDYLNFTFLWNSDSINENIKEKILVLNTEEKTKIIKENKINPKDTGSPEVQIALITNRINYLSKHFETHKHDHHSKTGLMKLVGKRKRLLEYLKKEDITRYSNLIKKLGLRK